jgi:ATP synthase protein I
MTTETHQQTRGSGLGAVSLRPGVLGGVFAATVAVGALMVLLGGVADGRDAAIGALTGSGIVAAVLAFGCGNLALVARLAPGATLLVALVTYLAQAVVLVLVAVRLSGTETFSDGPGRLWLGLGLIAGMLTWMTVQLLLTVRARIPIYDLPDTPSEQASDESRPATRTGGER